MKNIVETATAAGSFKNLVNAIKAAGLVDTLSGPGPFTVFAPNDAAFSKIPSRQLQDLLRDKKKLRSVLTYHVVNGRISSSDVSSLHSARTVQGQDLSIDASRGVMVGDARVIQKDIRCSNGVIHVIDKVLMPRM
ncbi:MAG: fasciclin domain-containing protein [Candidatus Bathyarchaeota archaeon]|nr:fasciclin domain-containing protein [Candidatus Bathyarchaeota archaeon]